MLRVKDPDREVGYCEFVESLKKRLQVAYEAATVQADKSRTRQKQNYDVRIRGSVLETGDRDFRI